MDWGRLEVVMEVRCFGRGLEIDTVVRGREMGVIGGVSDEG